MPGWKHNRRRLIAVTVGAVAVAIFAVTGCRSSEPEPTVLEASWADAYPTVDEMTAHADAVAQVRITEIVATGVGESDVLSTPYTDFAAEVVEIIAGGSEAATIVIRQTGGEVDGEHFVVEGDPLLDIGAVYVVFVTEFEPGHYFINGGPTGRLIVSGNELTALPDSIMRSDEIPATTTELAEVIATLT